MSSRRSADPHFNAQSSSRITIMKTTTTTVRCRLSPRRTTRRTTNTTAMMMTVFWLLSYIDSMQAFSTIRLLQSRGSACHVTSTTASPLPLTKGLQDRGGRPTTTATTTTTTTRLSSIADTPNDIRHNNSNHHHHHDDDNHERMMMTEVDRTAPWLTDDGDGDDDDHHHNLELDPFETVEWLSIIDPPHPSESPDTGTSTTTTSSPTDPLTRADWRTLGVVSATVTTLLTALVRSSGVGAWRYYLAGGVCAAVSHAVPVPVDVVKTRTQVDPEYCDLDLVTATRRLVSSEGFSALFVGTGPTVTGYFLEGAVKFGVYEMLKRPVSTLIFPRSRILAYALCAAASGTVAGVLLCPMEALRIRLVAEPRYAADGWIRGGLRMLRARGDLTRGVIPMLCKQVPYTMTKNVCFDVLTGFLYGTVPRLGSVTIPLLAAALTSVLSCLSSQPGDMVLSVVSAHGGERRRTRDVVRQILRSDRGVRGFFVGVRTRFLHVGLIVTVQLLIYDLVKRSVGIAATGTA